MSDDYDFFKLRKEAKTYISKLFTWNEKDNVGKRNVSMVIDGSDVLHVGEIEGALCLRLNGNKRRTQVTALVTQDDANVRRVTLETFKDFGGDAVWAQEKEAFSFRDDEFERLVQFLQQINFINFDDKSRFQIEDISKGSGSKVVVDAEHRSFIEEFQSVSSEDRSKLLASLGTELTSEDVNILLGRRVGLKEFEERLTDSNWLEKN